MSVKLPPYTTAEVPHTTEPIETGKDIQDVLDEWQMRLIDEASIRSWAKGQGAPILTRRLTRKFKDQVIEAKSKINNRIQHNFLKRIIRIRAGYLGGNPVRYSHAEDAVQELITGFVDRGGLSDVHAMNISDCTAIGRSGRLIYIGESRGEPHLFVKHVPGERCIFVGDMYEPSHSIRVISEDTIEIYDTSNRTICKHGSTGWEVQEVDPHNLKHNPLIPYYNNTDRMGNAEDCLSKINDIDESRSNLSSLFAQQRLALHVFKDVDISTDQLEQCVQMGHIVLKTMDGQGDYSIETIPIPSEPLEKHIEELEKAVYLDSGVTNIEDRVFGSESGEAKKFYLLPMEANCKDTESKFRRSDYFMWRIFCDYYNQFGFSIWPEDIEATWTRALPVSRKEDAAWLATTDGRVPKRFIFANMDTVEDPVALADEFEREEERVVIDV